MRNAKKNKYILNVLGGATSEKYFKIYSNEIFTCFIRNFTVNWLKKFPV